VVTYEGGHLDRFHCIFKVSNCKNQKVVIHMVKKRKKEERKKERKNERKKKERKKKKIHSPILYNSEIQ